MPANTYTLIERITVGAAGASSITFTSIPQTYTDLKIVYSARSTVNGETAMNIYFNGSTTAVYDRISLSGNGSAASSASATNQGEIFAGRIPANDYTASTFGNTEIYIPNYTGSSNKSASFDSVSEQNATTAFQVLIAGLWKNTAAITSATLSISGANIAQYSTFYLYGIAKEGVSPSLSSAPYATGGDRIVFDGTYWYHAFTSSGTFTPRKNINCDVLVVGGGGSGGFNYGGGGGAGGVFYATSQSLSTAQTVTIGAGGAGAYASRGNTGSDSTFGSLTAAKGGGGGGGEGLPALNGGSGGGGIGYPRTTTPPYNAGGTSTQTSTGGTGYGFAGGTGAPNGAAYEGGGGGGGAGAVGGNNDGTSTGKGDGGIGTSVFSAWGLATSTGQNVSGTVYFAGGGGNGAYNGQTVAGAGGNGGGGRGSWSGGGQQAQTGTANTGGGGGGMSNSDGAPNNAGGSGIVIVRYAA